MPSSSVYSKPDDPNIYLLVIDVEFKYNPDEKPLGGGAMGTVYLGYNCRTGEKIAVKRVKDQYANYDQVRKRAKLEASLAFHHPNLVEMVGYCETAPDKGPIFILSKYVHGVGIKEYVRTHIPVGEKMRIKKICGLVYPVLDALSYIHSRRFIHRDIKPSNIMVENESNIRLMDLGIARMNGGNKFSQVGFIGTPQYSAPEQVLRGADDSLSIGPSTDIYALGVTVFELITGRNPYKSPTEVQTLTKQLKDKLPNNNMIPWALMKVLRKATEKDPAKRFQSADELKVALREAVAQGTTFVDTVRKYLPFLFK